MYCCCCCRYLHHLRTQNLNSKSGYKIMAEKQPNEVYEATKQQPINKKIESNQCTVKSEGSYEENMGSVNKSQQQVICDVDKYKAKPGSQKQTKSIKNSDDYMSNPIHIVLYKGTKYDLSKTVPTNSQLLED